MGSRDQVPNQEVRHANGRVRSFRDLVAWQKAFALGLAVYRLTAKFPSDERFGLVQQMRRCSVSIASNIAEGYGRAGRSDYTRFLKLARGSLYECDTQLMFGVELGYIPCDAYEQTKAQLDECERVLAGLIRALETEQSPSTP